MDKKYKLTDETINIDGHVLHRIKALRDFGDVIKGDFGGYIQKEENLSHNRDCWVYSNAKVYDNAKVSGNAKIFNNAMIYDNAKVSGNAKIFNDVEVYNHAWVYENAILYNKSEVGGFANLSGNTQLINKVKVIGNKDLYLRGETIITGDAVIHSMNDYIVFKNWWSSGRFFTWTRSNDMWTVGCFYGTGKELIRKAYKDSEISGREYERIVNYVESIK